MQNIIHKAKDSLHHVDEGTNHSILSHHDQPSAIHPPTPKEVMRYRYHYGTNLGSCFVLEKWLSPSMFTQGADSSELAAVTASINQYGQAKTKSKWETHWAAMISDEDFDWLVNVSHCTTIRLPIGYFTLGPKYCKYTPFAEAAPVYDHAWTAVTKLVSRARARGIGILIDFHALPGGANGGDHSGTNSGNAALWGNTANLDLATRCIVDMAHLLKTMDGVVGLQLCNEAEYNAPGMYKWCDKIIALLEPIDSSLPIYISDGWNLDQTLRYSNGKNSLSNPHCNPIVVDTHLYWAFSEADKAKSPQQITAEVSTKLSELDGKEGNVFDHGAAQLVVGEYSCVLTDESWTKAGAGADRMQLASRFGQAQSKRWQERAGGSYFWTYKMDWMDGGDWGFVQQTKRKSIKPPTCLALFNYEIKWRISHAQSQRTGRRAAAVAGHVNYWSHTAPARRFEHWRFEQGWDVGFSDAMTFLSMKSSGQLGHVGAVGEGGDRIGMLDLWVKKRIVESGMGGSLVWEFEAGLRQGIGAFGDAAEL